MKGSEANRSTLSTAAKLKYAELREKGMEIPDIAAALNLPEEPLQKFSREMELEGIDSQRLFWEMDLNPLIPEFPELDLEDPWNENDIQDLTRGMEISADETLFILKEPERCPTCGL